MKMSKRFSIAVAWLAVVGMCVPQVAFAATTSRTAPGIGDLALRDGGLLLGQVVKSDGTPLPNAPISLRSNNQELAAGVTDTRGYFAFSGVRSGTYQVATTGGLVTYQAWTAEAAPPTAQPGALIVTEGDTVRGQDCQPEPCCGVFKHPFVLGALIATAVAVPIAVSNSHKHHASGE